MSRPLIFDYDDYRRYLSDWFEDKKQEREQQGLPPYSHRMFVAEAGVPNVGVLVSVIKGDKHLTEALQAAFCIPLGLNEEERRFLGLLASRDKARRQLDQARLRSAEAEREAHAPRADKRARRGHEAAVEAVRAQEDAVRALEEAVHGARKMNRMRIQNEEQLRLLNAWSTTALMELTRCGAFRPDPSWIAGALGGRVSPEDMERTLALLLERGLLKVGEGGRLEPSDAVLGSEHEVQAHLVSEYYRGVVEQAGIALQRSFTDVQYAQLSRTGAMTVAIPSSAMKQVRERMTEFRIKIFEFFEGLQGEPDLVYQIWLQGFPLTEILGREPPESQS